MCGFLTRAAAFSLQIAQFVQWAKLPPEENGLSDAVLLESVKRGKKGLIPPNIYWYETRCLSTSTGRDLPLI
jgi:hypothetical protein